MFQSDTNILGEITPQKDVLRAFVRGSTSLDTIEISGQKPKTTLNNDYNAFIPEGESVHGESGWNLLHGQGYTDAEKSVKFFGNSRIIIDKTALNGKKYGQATIKPVKKRKSCQKTYTTIACDTCGEMYYVPISCNKRTCPDCSAEYADVLFFRLKDVIAKMEPKDGFRLRLLTLTRKTTREHWTDAEKIRELVKTTWGCFKKLYHNKIESGKEEVLEDGKWIRKKVSYKGKVGVLSALEFGGLNLNLHIHALVYSKWLDQKEMSREWERLTGDSYIVHVEEVQGGVYEKALRELTKYVCDFSMTTEKQKEDIEVALKGSRRIRTLGILYNCDELKREKKVERRCLKCGEKLVGRFIGGGVMADGIWKRILYQCAMWEINTAQLERMMSVKKGNTGGENEAESVHL